jgi:hypothetical protein
MSLPGFSATASLSKSNVTYQLESSGITSMEGVIPSMIDDDRRAALFCRIRCFRRFGTSGGADQCLLDCGD